MCKYCISTCTAETSVVKVHCFIANTVKAHNLGKTTDDQSVNDTARNCSVSEVTVQRVINKEAKKYLSYDCSLPAHLSFEKFKYAIRQIAFKYINVRILCISL